MKKLSLDLGALRVESFETDTEPGARGTVHGHTWPNWPCVHTDWGPTCPPTGDPSCYETACVGADGCGGSGGSPTSTCRGNETCAPMTGCNTEQ